MPIPLFVKRLINATVYAYDPVAKNYERHAGLIVDGGHILSLDPAEAGAGVETVDLRGAVVMPAFADCHVHLTDTGYMLGERNLWPTRSYAEFAQAVGRLRNERYVCAGNYDESTWRDGGLADARPLETHFPEAYAMLVRIDGHSSIVNRKTFGWLDFPDGTQGIEKDAGGSATGRLSLQANWIAQARFFEALPLREKRAAEGRAANLALSRGALHLHVQLVGFARDRYAGEIESLPSLAPAKWYPKICEPDAALARSLGLPFVGGDVFLDGSIGSCTAAVSQPFAIAVDGGTPGNGALRFSDDEVFAYLSEAHRLGIAAGVHAIGDRAIEQCIATWERVLGGAPSPQRHFIEHFEIATQDHIERCARLGIYLSMQPQFDLLWGGKGNMYDVRLGTARMETMNALARAQAAGAILCGGDDSPVCDLSPLTGMHAATHHHTPGESLTPEQALTMYTYNAALFGHAEERTGRLAPGYAADFAILDRDPLNDGDFARASVLQTWSDGAVVFDSAATAH
ncbi:MAG: amidohydrolase family protein [Candidatus Eremiobacteraeota bacterium]|nr:amidohydrolase family protein [Candidatus Eremiobacteraeota bacterium]